MAKRIKVTGKPPRAASENPMSRPSSTRKKLVKEGNRKFIGPRQLSSELAEDRGPRSRGGFDAGDVRAMVRKRKQKSDPFTEGLSPKVRDHLLAYVKAFLAQDPNYNYSPEQERLLKAVDASGWFRGNYDTPRI
jgi:hypothetical protein